MTVVLTCGHIHSDLDKVHETLTAAGLGVAYGVDQEKNDPIYMANRICEAYRLNCETQLDVRQVELGAVWNAMCANLMINNLHQPAWGWADPSSVYLLEHWRDFDSQTRFILIYSSPERAIAQMFEDKSITEEGVEHALTAWKEVNTELLRFYNMTRERSMLINVSSVGESYVELIQRVNYAFEIDLMEPVTAGTAARDASHIVNLLSSLLISGADDAQALYRELESAADFPSAIQQSELTGVLDAWNQYTNSLGEIESASQKLESVSMELEKSRRLVSQHQEEIGTITVQVEDANKVSEGLASQLMQVQEKLEKSYLENRASTRVAKENESLVDRLQKVQEELEKYFNLYQETKNELSATKELTSRSALLGTGLEIDMRKNVDGENWHAPEPDGRWAGPNTSSTVVLPVMPSGNYRLELDIVGTMSQEILRQMEVSVNGRNIRYKEDGEQWALLARFSKKSQELPIALVGKFEIKTEEQDESPTLGFDFPGTISPSVAGSEDTRDLAVRLRKIRIVRSIN